MVAALDEAERFITPVLNASNRRGQSGSIIDILLSQDDIASPNSDDRYNIKQRKQVIARTLRLIQDLHASCNTSSNALDQLEPLARQKGQKVVDALLDLLVLEGIYPSLTPGVGVPVECRLKSILKGGFSTRPLNEASGGRPEDQQLLTDIVGSIAPISLSRTGLAPIIRQRICVDLLAAVGELAFSPAFDAQTRQRFATTFKNLMDSMSAMDLFPHLTSLLHSSSPHWFRAVMSSYLAILPLRPGGVRQTLNFIADSTADDSTTPDGRSNQSAGPNISFEALARATKLLTSVPSTMTPDTYTAALAPQLLDLLDDDTVLDNKRIASYVIGTGFLSKRRLGSPGTTGWRLFAESIVESLNPRVEICPVGEDTLKTAIDRLCALVLFHANPGLTKRLVGPILLPLWGLQCYAFSNRRTSWADQVHQILGTHMKISATDGELQLLSDNLLWDGAQLWTYMPGSSGGIEIRQRQSGTSDQSEVATMIEAIDSRVDQYMSLLREAVVTDDQVGGIFTRVSTRWLLGSQSTSKYEQLEILYHGSRNPMESLVNAKLTQKLLENYRDRIASSTEGILKLVEPILSALVTERRRSIGQLGQASQPSLAGLREVVDNGEEVADSERELEETASTALSLLSAVLTSSDGSLGNIDIGILDSVQSSLKYIAQVQSSQDTSLSTTASNVLILLQLQFEAPSLLEEKKGAKGTDGVVEERDKHRKALQLLSDELAPVRAQGLATLTNLVARASSILNVPSTVILLISLLQDEDEYIYLSAVKTLGLLASNHPKTVIKMLVEKYIDPHEESLVDVRIKVGEALNKTIEHLGQLFTEETAKMIGESMIAVASRRGNKPKTLQRRERAKRKAEKTRKEAEDAWGGEIPSDEDANNEEARVNAHIAKIVEGWADTGREEDVRIRVSALSILGTAIETNIAGMGATITSTAIDCVLAILKLEKNEERAILRRAAVMIIMSMVRAIDAAEERGQQLGFGFAGDNLAEVITVLRYVEAMDTDEVVVGHIRALIESLEAWQQKSILGLSRSQHDQEGGVSIDIPRIGGGGKSLKIQELD
ncbi:MAG: hypothetical protein Q9225_005823 [Loekoesia sp. 1 TL-2023]